MRHLPLLLFSLLTLSCALPSGIASAQNLCEGECPTYTGIWTPDHAANRTLAKATRKEMRKRMSKLKPKPQDGEMPRAGGMPGGGMPGGGMPPGGMPPGGKPPAGMGPDGAKPDIDPLRMMSTAGMMRPEMDFAAPLEGDLQIAVDRERAILGKRGEPGVELNFRRGARELADGDVRAYADYEQGNLVVELNTEDGAQVTHTYVLEAGGERLRIKTLVLSREMPIPGGVRIERLYQRTNGAQAP